MRILSLRLCFPGKGRKKMAKVEQHIIVLSLHINQRLIFKGRKVEGQGSYTFSHSSFPKKEAVFYPSTFLPLYLFFLLKERDYGSQEESLRSSSAGKPQASGTFCDYFLA
jgi:hypothetical protein